MELPSPNTTGQQCTAGWFSDEDVLHIHSQQENLLLLYLLNMQAAEHHGWDPLMHFSVILIAHDVK